MNWGLPDSPPDYRHCSMCEAYLIRPDPHTAIEMEIVFREHFPRTWDEESRQLVCDLCADKIMLRRRLEGLGDGEDEVMSV